MMYDSLFSYLSGGTEFWLVPNRILLPTPLTILQFYYTRITQKTITKNVKNITTHVFFFSYE